MAPVSVSVITIVSEVVSPNGVTRSPVTVTEVKCFLSVNVTVTEPSSKYAPAFVALKTNTWSPKLNPLVLSEMLYLPAPSATTLTAVPFSKVMVAPVIGVPS